MSTFQDSSCRTAKNLVRLGLRIKGSCRLQKQDAREWRHKDKTWEELISMQVRDNRVR
jgi:hypothetical protein